ncbi:paraquat-inducible membrane protein A [Acinetobacter sp. ANC 4558]|uniref:paraquat-inducible protein A n=1 Tax=Acinetobacter sp. ANC 4558 TaxID=1977876 RepID=UPI000A34B627|nr:paraquat-inducible protein A [Acinetobacter sp. ANC 4558]OTG87078.1 paraquat-inducible membrane protein A [Acinetobacter sp. ANC 4558]
MKIQDIFKQFTTQHKNKDDALKNHPRYIRAQDLSLMICQCCGLLNTYEPNLDNQKNMTTKCTRCSTKLRYRKQNSLSRTFALVLAASILYIPANLLPMTITDSLFGSQKDTILTGVIYFWQSGDYLVATIIFCASIFIPLLKLIILFFLLIAVHFQSTQRVEFSPSTCAKLYRIVEMVGRWSMIDVFVVSLLTALIQIQSLATIFAGPGAVAFAAVVVLTLFASLSFDPRIIWDNYFIALDRDLKQDKLSENLTIIKEDPILFNNSSNANQ